MTQTTILGFIGTGRMGTHMVRRLLAGGYRVLVNDATEEAARPCIAAGAQWRETPASIVRAMLPPKSLYS